ALVDVFSDEYNNRSLYGTIYIIEEHLFIGFFEFAEILDAHHATLRHHRQLLRRRDRISRIVARKIERRIVEFSQQRAAHSLLRNQAGGFIAQISFRPEKKIDRLDWTFLQGLREIFCSANWHLFFHSEPVNQRRDDRLRKAPRDAHHGRIFFIKKVARIVG